jgi:ABC-type proline/glycine betaine transport system permease subunit
MVILAVVAAPGVVVYLASGGSATVMHELGHLYLALAIPVGLAILIIGMVVSRVQRKRRGPRV